MESKFEPNSVIRNSVLNLVGQCVPLTVGLFCVPLIANGIGPERFGVLSLAWILLASFSIFDLGMGRAVVKLVAEDLGKGQLASLSPLVWSAILLQLLLGIAAGSLGFIVFHYWGGRIVHLSAGLSGEAITTFEILMFGLPVVLVTSTLGGVLEAYQRFDITNFIRIISTSVSFALPILGIAMELDLARIVLMLVCAKFFALIACLTAVLNTSFVLRKILVDRSVLRRLLRFGGWITVSNSLSPILVNLDRYMLAALLPITAVGYYTPTSQAILYVAIIPASIASTLFPTYSTLSGMGNYDRIQSLFARSTKYTLLVLTPLLVVIALFSRELLTAWIGHEYAAQGTMVLKILAAGVLINSLAIGPSALLQAMGRPDLPAKFHMLELPIHVLITWSCINNWAIIGAAIACSIRVVLDAIMLFAAAFRHGIDLRRHLIDHQVGMCAILVIILVAASLNLNILAGTAPLIIRVMILCIILTAFGVTVWRTAVDPTDRDLIRNFIRNIGRRSSVEQPSTT